MIRTKSIHDTASPEDGTRLLITRYHPRGVAKARYDVWWPDLAPSRELLRAYKDGMPWAQFERAFTDELRGEYGQAALMDVRVFARAATITLLCHEPEGEPCHRHIVKRLIEHDTLN